MPSSPPSRARRVVAALGRGTVAVAKGVARHPDVALALLAGIALAIAWPTIHLTQRVPSSLQPVFALMSVAPLVLLRREPFIAWAVSTVGSLIWFFVPRVGDWPMPWPVMHFLVLLLTVVVVALLAPARQVALTTAVTAGWFLLVMPWALKPWALGVLVIVAFALLARWLRTARRQLASREEEAETERDRRAVLEERSRIARELHDVVAHHMSMVVVQAQSAPYRVEAVSPEAKEEFAGIESAARQALTEVRGVLGLLREDRADPETAPQPSLADLPSLLEASRAAGMELRWSLDLEDCPPGTALVLHRVLGEALANAARHAPGASVVVELREHAGHAELSVSNSPGSSPSPVAGGGHGIEGMHARAQAVGGHVITGAIPGGGFEVRARLPLTGRPGAGEDR